ncbi:MAG TPA: dienelactone hydrolase family protein [Pyrinomonadaceae bacterium]|jgi:carboxymethylenebutenolidase|nr:dienelactone hydrolase family protein [Pyrinomonadaceae bacterium]
MRKTFVVIVILLTAISASAQEQSSAHHQHVEHASFTAPAQDFAKQRLDKSPRHQEWVTTKSGDRIVHSFLVYPEVKNKALAVVVIHENRGLTDWVRSVADQLAEAGYIAIAPDMLSGMAPNGGRTSDFADGSAIGEAFAKLSPERITADLGAVADHVRKLPAANGKIAVAGFCWGGRQTFRFATNRPDLAAAFVFYGNGPETKDEIARIKAPVYGFYGGNDARVNATIPKSAELMKEAGKKYEPVTYEGAGHGFMRAGEEPNADAANKKARDEAWSRWKSLLKKL